MGKVNAGTGNYRYELLPSWGELPNGWEFGAVSSVATDSKGRVYACNRGEHPVVVFDSDGHFLASWGEDVIMDSHGIFIDHDDDVYIVDRDAHQVLKFTSEGDLLLVLGDKGCPSEETPFNHPADVTVSSTGDIYVSDGYANSRVHKFSTDGKYLLSWGIPGSSPGAFRVPHGIAMSEAGRVYVADRENNRIQLFTSDGAFITQWTDFEKPMAVFVDANQAVYVSDQVPRLTIVDSEGNLLSRGRIGGTGHGIWVDSKGDLYVGLTDAQKKVLKYVRKN